MDYRSCRVLLQAMKIESSDGSVGAVKEEGTNRLRELNLQKGIPGFEPHPYIKTCLGLHSLFFRHIS